jgi:hypothetical protein
MRGFDEIMAAHRDVLRGEWHGLLLNGKPVEPDVWLARNVMLHPSAVLVPPVYIGADCEVAAGARVGPNVIVGPGCVIDRRATLADSLVLPGTYLGEAVDLEDAIVDRDRVARAHPGGQLRIEVDCAVASLADKTVAPWIARVAWMATGLLLLLLLTPVLVLVALVLRLTRQGKVLHVSQVVRLPAEPMGSAWATFGLWSYSPPGKQGTVSGVQHLVLRVLPALVNVARGELCLVGLPPRTPEEVEALDPDLLALYLRSRVGIISETLLIPDPLCEEEVYATEGFYAVRAGWAHDLGLVQRYLVTVLRGGRLRVGTTPPAGAGSCEKGLTLRAQRSGQRLTAWQVTDAAGGADGVAVAAEVVPVRHQRHAALDPHSCKREAAPGPQGQTPDATPLPGTLVSLGKGEHPAGG